MPLTNLYQAVKDGVVQVIALNGKNVVGLGSGSVIDTGKTVLTCAHCIVPGMQMAIADPKTPGQALFGNVTFHDQARDIALLEFPIPVGTPVKLASSAQCAVGNGAFVVGYPMQIQEQVLLSAHIASLPKDAIRIDASVNHGNSGGPLFNLAGEQVGVINAKHGSLSEFLTQLKNAAAGNVFVAGVDPIKVMQQLVQEMQQNLNLGIGYAIPTDILRPLHATFIRLVR